MRTHVIAMSVAILFCAPALTIAQAPQTQDASSTFSPALAGTWTSAPDEMRLTSDFDVSVWGANAKSVRTVELTISPSAEATLVVSRRVVDGKGRTVTASSSTERAQLKIGGSQRTVSTRVEHDVTVVKATRSYPDDPGATWDLAGLQVEIVTFTDGNGNTLEVRVDTPEGRGSFWQTLTRQGRKPSRGV